MSSVARADLVSAFDQAPLGTRYWMTFIRFSLGLVLAYFDFYFAGFLVAAQAPQWRLT